MDGRVGDGKWQRRRWWAVVEMDAVGVEWKAMRIESSGRREDEGGVDVGSRES